MSCVADAPVTSSSKVTFYRFDECMMTSVCRHDVTHTRSTALIVPSALPSYLCLPLPPATTLIFHCLLGLAFSRMSYSWHQTGSRFWDWLLSPINMHWRFLHVCLWLRSSLPLNTNIQLIPQLLKDILIASRFWQLGIKLLETRYLCGHTFSAPLGKYQEAWLLDHLARVC